MHEHIEITDAALDHLRQELYALPLFGDRYLRITPKEDGYSFMFSNLSTGDVVYTERGLSIAVRKDYESLVNGKTLDYEKTFLLR